MMLLISGAFSSSFAFAQIEPTTKNDFYSVNEDSLLTIAPMGVLLNDTNIDSNIFAILQTNVGFGTLTFNSNGTFTYLPNQNFHSVDSFTYVATNGTHNSNIATVTLSVNSINDAPIARNDTASTLEDVPVKILVLNNDSDVDGDILKVNSVTQGTNGTVTTNGTAVTYTPKLNFNGIDSFTYIIYDGVNTSNSATIKVTVVSVDDNTDNNTDREIIKNQLKILEKDFKVQEKKLKDQLKALEKDFKVQEKKLKDQLKALEKDKKSHKDEHDDDHHEIVDKKASQNELKTLKKELKMQVNDLKKQFKDTEKNLKNQLNESKKEKKSHNDND